MTLDRAKLLTTVAAVAVWTMLAHGAGIDEYGRETLSVLLQSMGLSLVRALQLVVPLILIVGLLVACSEVFGQRWVARMVAPLLDAIESVPSYLWVLAAVSASAQIPAVAGTVALGVALAPLAYSTLGSVLTEIMRQPFVSTAILSGLPRSAILRRHVFPHAVAPSIAVVLHLLGTSVAIYGSLGAFGFVNRQTLDLGTLLLRGREDAPLDASLLWLTLGGYCLLYLALTAISRQLLRTVRYSETAVGAGSHHVIWYRGTRN